MESEDVFGCLIILVILGAIISFAWSVKSEERALENKIEMLQYRVTALERTK